MNYANESPHNDRNIRMSLCECVCVCYRERVVRIKEAGEGLWLAKET